MLPLYWFQFPVILGLDTVGTVMAQCAAASTFVEQVIIVIMATLSQVSVYLPPHYCVGDSSQLV